MHPRYLIGRPSRVTAYSQAPSKLLVVSIILKMIGSVRCSEARTAVGHANTVDLFLEGVAVIYELPVCVWWRSYRGDCMVIPRF